MADTLYYCTQDNNDCPKKEECKRYININNEIHTTLFKIACTDENNRILFLNKLQEGDNNERQN